MQDWIRHSGSSQGMSPASSKPVKDNLANRIRQQSEPPLSRMNAMPEQNTTLLPPETSSSHHTSASKDDTKIRSQSVPRKAEPPYTQSYTSLASHRSQSAERPKITRSVSEQLPSTQYVESIDLSKQLPKPPRPTLGLRTGSLDSVPTGPLPVSANSSIRRQFKQRPDSIEEEDERVGHILSAMEPPVSTTTITPIADYRQRAPSHTRRPSLTLTLNPFRSRQASQERSHSTTRQPQGESQPQGSHPTTTKRTIRLKVHHEEDTRYIIAQENVTFEEVCTLIAKKFKLKESGLSCKTRDEDGDMVTIADQEDLEAAFVVCTERAEKEGAEHLRLKVCLSCCCC